MNEYIHYLDYLPSIVEAILLIIGLFVIFIGSIDTKKLMSNLSTRLTQASPTDKILIRAGIPLNTMQYKAILYVITGTIAALVFLYAIIQGIYVYIITGLAVSVLLIILFYPTEKLFGSFKSPFSLITDSITASRKKALDRELFSSCIALKNLAIVKERNQISADMIFEQLMENSTKLRPIYAEMIALYRTGRTEEAFDFFTEAIGTKVAKTFTSILSKLDKINPAELTEQVTVMQEAMSEKRLTDGLKKAERNGIITTSLATAVIFIIILNFAFVVIMLDTLDMLSSVF